MTPTKSSKSTLDGQIARFERWRKDLPARTAYLVSSVVETVVPLFAGHGLLRYPDYAANSSYAIGMNCIPLQRRSGDAWPTVEIRFDKRQRPFLGLIFSELPEICHRILPTGEQEILRPEANVVEGDAFFTLCKGSSTRFDRNFGYQWFALRPTRELDEECALLRLCSTWLLERFDEGLPKTWYEAKAGYVDPHAFMNGMSRTVRKKAIDGSS
jgi:hypothetical protein